MMHFARFRILVLLAVVAGLGFFAHGAQAQTYNRFGPVNGILVGDVSTYQTTAADSSDVISLWTGTCNASTFLRADGSCAAALSGTVAVNQGGTGATSLSGILLGNGTSPVTSAASSNVISLWTGTCNATTFLRADGSCQVVTAGPSPANPTATIGLTAVNGSAGTFLRSDGAPALSQAITPTWTNTHTFSGSVFLNGGTFFNRAVDEQARIGGVSGATNPFLSWYDANGVTRVGYVQGTAGGGMLVAADQTTGALALATNGSTRISIDDDGSWDMAGTTPGTLGQVLTSNGAGAAPTWQAGGAGSPAGVAAYPNASQSMTNNDATMINLGAELFDTGSYHDNTTNNFRVILPSATGYASCTGNITYGMGNTSANPGTPTNYRINAYLVKNNTVGSNGEVLASQSIYWIKPQGGATGTGDFLQFNVSNPMIPANGTDYVTMVLYPTGSFDTTGTVSSSASMNSAVSTRLTCTATK